ncbi:YdcF family protein [Paludibacterium paludis]|uniref:DUF218 domain-containing protein n=1 Tax=Paludibacterium paludis TaxID=1225769 RepID=A0A918UBB6_9NEIS|nr:YdcF family protein [Paludibacterium paludis]GGY21140.1 hypothetical protein GCM10011289_26040 [Paludibacterium paludis]
MSATFSPDVLVHQLLGAFFLPPLAFILPILAGVAIWRRFPGAGRGLVLASVAAQYLLSTPAVSLWLNGALETSPPARVADVAATDAIVVLGGGKRHAPEYGRTELSADTLIRVKYGAWLARRTGKPLLVTGGAPLGGEPEARVMARTLAEDYGVNARWQEDASATTRENARFSAAILKPAGVRRIALVTQGWHLPRAAEAFRLEGFDVLPAPTGFIRHEGPALAMWIPRASAMSDSATALRERVGMIFYSLTAKRKPHE